MSGSLWARFRKTEKDDDSLDRDVSERQSGPKDGAEVADVGPDGLSFEEGTLGRSFVTLLLGRTSFMNRHCWRAWPSPRRHLVHASHRRTHPRHRHLLDTILDFERGRLRWSISHALGSWIRSLLLWVVYLARVWDDVSAEWWREGLLGGCVYGAEIPRYGCVRCERDLAWIHCEWVYCKCGLGFCILSDRLTLDGTQIFASK